MALGALAVLLCLFSAARPALAQGGFAIIVNSENPVSSLSKDAAGKLFLKKTTRWETGESVQPVDLAESSGLRDSFSKGVLGRSVAAVKSYWQQQIFSGRGTPPVEKATEAEIVAYVRANGGAIAYVTPATAAQARGVKVIAVE